MGWFGDSSDEEDKAAVAPASEGGVLYADEMNESIAAEQALEPPQRGQPHLYRACKTEHSLMCGAASPPLMQGVGVPPSLRDQVATSCVELLGCL